MMHKTGFFVILSFTTAVLLQTPARAASFCDLVSVAELQSVLGTSATLLPNVTSNGCDYNPADATQHQVSASVTASTGNDSTDFVEMPTGTQKVPGIGDEAFYYVQNTPAFSAGGQNFPALEQQYIVFRQKGKIVNLMVGGPTPAALPQASIVKLGQLVATKPIEQISSN